MSRGCPWAGSVGGPPICPLWIDPRKDWCAGTAAPRRSFGAVFLARARCWLQALLRQIFSPPQKFGFQRGTSAALGCRCDLRWAPLLRPLWLDVLHAPLRGAQPRPGALGPTALVICPEDPGHQFLLEPSKWLKKYPLATKGPNRMIDFDI